ncbi:MAG: hypothetical protein ABIS38_04890 [Sphingomicrobium sp.]
MRGYLVAVVLAGAAMMPSAAIAAPGLGSKVYGATIEPGETELELRYGRLTGGDQAGEDALVFEAAHHFANIYAALLAEFEREPHGDRKLSAIAGEAILPLGQIAGIDTALYGEYEAVIDGPDAIEAKLLLQKRAGQWDSRLNLIAGYALSVGGPVEFGYAASTDVEIAEEVRVGVAAFGGLGSSRNFSARGDHYAGPVVKTAIEHLAGGELEIEAGYLFAIGRARDEADGQLRLLLEFAKHF